MYCYVMLCYLLQCSVAEWSVLSCHGMSCEVMSRHVCTYVCMLFASVAMFQALEWLVDFNCPKIISHPVVAARPSYSNPAMPRSERPIGYSVALPWDSFNNLTVLFGRPVPR